MFSVFLLALALSADAFTAAFSYGLVIKKDAFRSALRLSAATALGQFVMPVAGYFATASVSRHIMAVDHWIAFFVFLLLGINVIRGALAGEGKEPAASPELTVKLLLLVGVGTSIDACVAGISLYFMETGIWQAAGLIGAVCFVCTFAGFYVSRVFCRLPTRALQVAAGVVLMLLGVKILYDHLSSSAA